MRLARCIINSSMILMTACGWPNASSVSSGKIRDARTCQVVIDNNLWRSVVVNEVSLCGIVESSQVVQCVRLRGSNPACEPLSAPQAVTNGVLAHLAAVNNRLWVLTRNKLSLYETDRGLILPNEALAGPSYHLAATFSATPFTEASDLIATETVVCGATKKQHQRNLTCLNPDDSYAEVDTTTGQVTSYPYTITTYVFDSESEAPFRLREGFICVRTRRDLKCLFGGAFLEVAQLPPQDEYDGVSVNVDLRNAGISPGALAGLLTYCKVSKENELVCWAGADNNIKLIFPSPIKQFSLVGKYIRVLDNRGSIYAADLENGIALRAVDAPFVSGFLSSGPTCFNAENSFRCILSWRQTTQLD